LGLKSSMASSIAPLNELSETLLLDFLQRTGMSREVAQWRYFDSIFNRGRNRGFAWVPRDRVEGMIGLVPFRVAGAGPAWEANWSCDWMLAAPSVNPGMGILLLKQAIEESNVLFALGGNDNTRRLLPRIAKMTIPGAGVSLHLPLRLGALLERLHRRGAMRHLPLPRAAYMIPLRWIPRGARLVKTESGLARPAARLIEASAGEQWAPAYDVNYVDWQIGRSPVLVSATSLSPDRGPPRAAALYWRRSSSSKLWRLALWSAADSSDHLTAVLREAISQIYDGGGMAISMIVSRLEVERLSLLKGAGFVAKGRRDLYGCTSREGARSPVELSGLSYLDTDLAYRF
jgi:hypothetical protein